MRTTGVAFLSSSSFESVCACAVQCCIQSAPGPFETQIEFSSAAISIRPLAFFHFFLFLFFLHFNSLSAIKFCNLQQCGVFAPARFQHLSSYFFSHFLCPITTLKFFFFYFSLHLSYRLFIAFTSSPSPVCVFSFYCLYF